MKRIPVILCLMALHTFLKCQITMQTNLPKAIPLNSEITFEVKIKKGSSSNFAKYQMETPRGTTIKEVDSKSGSFTFEENVVKIIWVMAPVEPEFIISLKLTTGVIPGKRNFVQKYFYVENEDKKEVEMEPVIVMFKDSMASAASVSTEEFVTVIPKAMPSLLTTTINAAEISTKNPGILIQQVMQLKKDSKDAYVVGEKEKRKAELNLSDANTAITKAEAITNEAEKKSALEKANQAKQKAQSDLEVAERVLILAKSLEDNANEIETINRSVNPGSYSAQNPKTDPTIAARNQANATSSNNNTGTSTTVNLDENEESGTARTNLKKSGKKEREPTATENGLVYKIQLGAFSKEPSKSDFKTVGRVKITEEDGMYKVLYGSYTSKEEAFKQREQIISKGFDGFVVSYKDGVRIK